MFVGSVVTVHFVLGYST